MNNKRILVVEDQPITAMDEQRILEAAGYNVTGIVPSGEDAVLSVNENRPDLVLMDIKLKGKMDGIKTASKIRKQHDIPIVFVTAHGDKEFLDRAKKIDPYGYVLKPFGKEILSNTIELAVYKHGMEKKLRKSGEKYQRLTETANAIAWEMDISTWCFTYVSDYAVKLLGYPVERWYEKDFWADHLYEDDRDMAIEYCIDATRCCSNHELDYRMIANDGAIVWLRDIVTVHSDNGVPVSLSGIMIDITDRKEVEEKLHNSEETLHARVLELNDAKCRLEEEGARIAVMAEEMSLSRDQALRASVAKSAFLASMSHELRTPLNAIMGFSQMMAFHAFGPLGDSHYEDYANDILGSGAHLLDLINDILDLSRVEAGKLELKEEEVDTKEVVRYSIAMVREQAASVKVALDSELDKSLPRLFADRRMLRQILLNLLSNAIKFTPEGGRVTLSTALDSVGGITFKVVDTGIGIASEDITSMLSPYVQVDSMLARKHKGHGLGVPLTNSLIELHGGRLEISSQVGKGTMVIVSFPAERTLFG